MNSDSLQTAKPPRQSRSKKTRDSLLDAAERLLKNKPWEKISTVSIMIEAGVSNGAIYGRFKNKDAILVELYERHDQRLKERFSKRQKSRKQGQSIDEYFDEEIEGLIANFRKNRWLLKAMGTLSRMKPEIVDADRRAERKKMFDQIGAGFMEFEEKIDERRVELAIFFVATIIREAILYQGPHFKTLEMGDAELKESMKRMAFCFLGISA